MAQNAQYSAEALLADVLRFLKENRSAFSLDAMEGRIGRRLDNNATLMKHLNGNIPGSGIKYADGMYSFTTQYSDYTKSKADFLNYISRRPGGVKVNAELLESNPNVNDWISEMLRDYEVRAVRFNSKAKCENTKAQKKERENISKEDLKPCDLYGERCKHCINNLDLVLFSLSKLSVQGDEGMQNIEDIFFDENEDMEEIRSLWKDAVPYQPLEFIEKQFNIKAEDHSEVIKVSTAEAKARKKARDAEKRAASKGGKPSRFQKQRVNTHLN